MIDLYKSHSLTILADAMGGHMAETETDNPLRPLTVVVPNRDTARWVTLYLARKNGLVANIRYMLPSEWIWKVIRKKFPALPEHLASDPDPIKWALADEFLKDDQGGSVFRIKSYLDAQPEEQREKAAIKLAESIASVFDAYLFYRPEMITEWEQGLPQKGDADWQARLWRRLSERWTYLHGGKPYSHNKAQLFEQVMASQGSLFQEEGPIWVFNPGLFPAPVVRMMKKAGGECPIRIYQLQPSAEMSENNHPLFASFGREAVRIHALFQEAADQTHHLFEPLPAGRTLLGTLQSEIVAGSVVTQSEDQKEVTRSEDLKTATHCPSVQIRSCHSPLREIEVLHDFLLSRFEADESLNPEDILVVTPDPEQYIPYVQAVFNVQDGDLPRIPVHIGNPGTPGAPERAVTELLELAGSAFEKEDLLALIRSEAVRTALRLSESDCDRIDTWAEENHVLWGLDYGNGLPAGSPVNNSWDKMMERGWMGQLLGNTDPLGGGPLVYDRIHDRSRQEVWASLAVFLRKLHNFRSGSREKKNLGQWCVWFRHQLGDLLGTNFLMDPESEKVVRFLQNLTETSQISGSRTPISFDQFRSELIAGLQSDGAAGARFTRGVIFSSMVPVRGLPFRIIALVGLNDLSFPRRSGSPDFDLMTQDARPGERNRKEEDRNLFLQSVLSASDVHYCSYMGQSKVDNEEIPPSVVLQQWVDILKDMTGQAKDHFIAREPITGFSEKKYTKNSRAFSVGYERTSRQMRSREGLVSGLEGRLAEDPISDKNRSGSEVTQVIDLRDLTSFVRSPVAHFFQDRFRIRMSDFHREKEEFSLTHLDVHLLFSQLLEWKISGAEDPQILALLKDSGAVPHGWPGKRTANNMLFRAGRALDRIRSMGWTPAQSERNAEVTFGDIVIRGTLESRASDVILDIFPSAFSGRNVVQSWVKHLVWGCATDQWDKVYVMTDLKQEKPNVSTFLRPEDPHGLLQELIALYQRGRSQPEIWMPNTITDYLMGKEGKEESDGHAKAKNAFEGGMHAFGESRQEEVQLLLGGDPVYTNELVSGHFANWMEKMVTNREVIS